MIFWWVSEKLIHLFIRGCILGFIGAAATLILVVFLQHKRLSFKPAGVIFALAFFTGKMAVHPVPVGEWFALLLFAISQELSGYAAKLRFLFLISGAIFLAFYSFRSEPLWLQMFFVAASVSASLGIATFEKRHSPLITTLLLLLSVGSIFTTVPDTEEIALLIGILLVATIALSVSPARSGNWLGTVPLTMVLVWVICIEGMGRPASIITSIGCLGFLILEPLVHVISRFANWSLVFPAVLVIAFHSLSITIALEFARTTSNIGQATIATIAALGTPIIFIILAEAQKRMNFLI